MGSKITAKYSGMCKICGSDWNVGQIIFYQKTPKAICSDSECFNEQGGSVSNTFQSSFKPTTGSSFMKEKTKFVMPDVEVPDTLTVAAEVVVAAPVRVSGTSTSGITNFVFSFIKELPVVGLNED
jgi:hypothetical protein